jgi:hypothetical protein
LSIMVVICSTHLRLSAVGRAADAADAAIVRVSADAGAGGIFVGAGCLLGDVGPLAAQAFAAGLSIPALALPLPERPPLPGKRLPRLGAEHADERAAAVEMAARGLEAGAAIGARHALLDFGPVPLAVSPAEVARFFARRELQDDDPGAAPLAAALAERKARSGVLLDACRWAIEALSRRAEADAVTLLLPIGATPWQAPSPREIATLLEGFAGGPLAVAWDPGRLSVLRALGLAPSVERAQALAASSAGVVENDAVGMDAGYLPGLGERDDSLPVLPRLPAAAPVIITGAPDATSVEIAAAAEEVRRRYAD